MQPLMQQNYQITQHILHCTKGNNCRSESRTAREVDECKSSKYTHTMIKLKINTKRPHQTTTSAPHHHSVNTRKSKTSNKKTAGNQRTMQTTRHALRKERKKEENKHSTHRQQEATIISFQQTRKNEM